MKIHISQSIRGALTNWKYPDDYIGALTDSNGKDHLSPKEAKEFLLQALSEGKELLPMGDCEGFDYKKGCPGHRK